MVKKGKSPECEYIAEVSKNDIEHIHEIQKFNPYHDRLGRFTSRGGGAGVSMGVGSAPAGGKKEAVAGTIRDVEKANKDLDHEVATIVNPDTGKVLFSKSGDRFGVSFNSSEQIEIARTILTHNHPDNSIFSPMDVAMSYHLKSIRATNPDGTVYELGNMKRRDAIAAYNTHYRAARSDAFDKLGIDAKTRDRDLTDSQRADSFSYISDSCHKWLSDNASKYGYQYEKGRIES
jgi:hypothetical protein